MTRPPGIDEQRWIGRPVRSEAHRRLVRGQGRFVDDIPAHGALYAAFVRSPVAHARVLSFDATAARADDRTALVLGPDEIEALTDPIPTSWQLFGQQQLDIPLAAGVARYVGQPIGILVATSRAAAEDLVELVELELEPLPAVTTVADALEQDAVLIHPETGSNLTGQIHFGDPVEDLAASLAGAAHVVTRRFTVSRVSHSPMETRGLIADWAPGIDQLTVFSSTQSPHAVRQELAAALRLRVDQVRVVAPDIGGSFGGKVTLYVDEALVCLASKQLGRRVKWIEDRVENLTTAYQGRGQVVDASLALDADGRFLALSAEVMGDLGAFAIQAGSGPFQVTGLVLEGPYRFDRAGATVSATYTNLVPTGAYRGYGMQEAAWVRERLVDEAARELGIDPVQLRLRNLVTRSDMPFLTRTQLNYDSGDYPAALRRAAELAQQHHRRSTASIRRGTAVTSSVEITGFAPSALLEVFHIDWAGWEGGRLRVNQDGTVTAFSGVIAVGQGIETTLAQIVAERLGIPMNWVSVQLGDTAVTPYSDLSSQASRSLVLAGGALWRAADRMRARMFDLAARQLGAEPGEVSLDAGSDDVTPDKALFSVRDSTASSSWAEVAHRGWKGWGRAEADRIQLEETVDFDPVEMAFAYSAHAAAVAVDIETGKVTVEGYWAVHDSGVIVNPKVADGQIRGGIAQGIGLALTEEAAHDPAGQSLASSLYDYLLPTSRDIPAITVEHRCTPSETMPGGFKGLGEGGAIPPAATIAAAIAAAVPEIAEQLTTTPLTPERLWLAFEQATAAASPAEGRQ
jgi:carbon-monoxide dehydrogenase large subunit